MKGVTKRACAWSLLLGLLGGAGTYIPAALAASVPAGTEEEIRLRTQPEGRLCRVGIPCPDPEAVPAQPAESVAQDTAEPPAAPAADAEPSAPAPEPAARAPVASAAPAGRTGEQVYNQFCFACHNLGVAGAPLLKDSAQWEPRIAKGLDVLIANSINGFNNNLMPPKGSCINCSDEELRAAVEYMLP